MELKNLLKDAALLLNQVSIDGQRCPSDSGTSFEVWDRATGAALGSLPLMEEAETGHAIAAANAAWPAWRARAAKELHCSG